MRKSTIIIASLFVISLVYPVQAVYFEDGASYMVNDSAYQSDGVILDFRIANNPGTHLDLVSGGLVESVLAYNNSTADIRGGTISGNLDAHNNSKIDISGGIMSSYVNAIDNSSITIRGGVLYEQIRAWDSATIRIRGGEINTYIAADEGTIYLYGSNFKVGGVDLTIGDNLRNYGALDSYGMWIHGTITGTLQNGSMLNSDFYISDRRNSAIFIVPEPCTLLLLGLGAVRLRSRQAVVLRKRA